MYYYLIVGSIFLLAGIAALTIYLQTNHSVEAAWYNNNWDYRQPITVTVANNGSDISNLETLLTINTSTLISAGKLQSACQDLRFTSQSGKLLPYYIDSGCNKTTTKVWVAVDKVPANTTTYTLYMYYGNPSAAAGSDSKRFDLFKGLIGYWPMNEAANSWNDTSGEVKDASVNGNTGTGVGYSGSTSPSTSGKYANAGNFNGSSQYVSVSNTISGISTISFWVNPTSTTTFLLQLSSGVDIKAVSGVISTDGITSPTIYVNGQVSTTLTSGVWQLITVTYTSALTGSDIRLGQTNTTFSATGGTVTTSASLGTVTEYPVSTAASQFITAGPDGNLWFTDNTNNKIGNVTTGGSATFYTVPTLSSNPSGIAAGPDGNLWFTESNTNKIGKVTTSGTFTEYTIPTLSSDSFVITAGPDGNLWFTEGNTNKIGKVTTSGTFTEYTIPTLSSAPRGITTGPDGNLWFTEFSGNKIGKVTTSGTFTEYTIPTGTSQPWAITTGPDGNLWFTESNTNKIGKVTTSGTFTEYTIPTGTSSPYGITEGPDGNLWFVEKGGNKVGKVTTSGTFNDYPVISSSSFPEGITAGPDGNVWFTEFGSHNVGNIGPGVTYNTFTSNGTFTPNAATNVQALVVGGGGGGGGSMGGGGGAGGLIYNPSFAVTATGYSITVGGGGGGGANGVNGTSGSNSVFSTLTAVGGGGGGHYSATAGSSGGSGGGGGPFSGAGGTATAGQGFAGGTAYTSNYYPGGGGGAGTVGENGQTTRAGNGGIGLPYAIGGASTWYAGGGGAGGYSGACSVPNTYGGLGGGGFGYCGGTAAVAATANTGGGGGGGGYTLAGAAGGSGIVIIDYNQANIANYFTGSMDDVRVYNRALSSSEITALYNNPGVIASSLASNSNPTLSFGSEQVGPNPMGYWKFNEGTGNIAHDSTTNANGGIAYNNDATQSTFSGTGSTWTQTTSGNNRLLLVSLSYGGSVSVSSVTYNGISLTKESSVASTNSFDINADVDIWYLVNPPSGSYTVSVTMSAGADVVANSMSFSNVNQSSPFGTPGAVGSSTSTGSTTPSVTVTSAPNQIVVDALAWCHTGTCGGTSASVASGQTQLYSTGFGNSAGAGSYITGSTSTSMSWTLGATKPWAIVAVPIQSADPSIDINNGTLNFPVAYNNDWTSGNFSASSNTWSQTTSGNNRLLVVSLDYDIIGGASATAVTYGGISLTKESSAVSTNSLDVNVDAEIWYLVNPPSGSNTISVTMSTGDDVVASSMSFSNVNQSSPFGTPGAVGSSTSTGSTTPSVTVTSAPNQIVIDALAWCHTGTCGGTSASVASGQTQLYSTGFNNSAGAGSYITGSTSTSMSWTLGATKPWAIVAVPIQSAGTSWQTPDQCISGGCLYFNGNGSYMSVSDNARLRFATSLSVGTWFKTGTTTNDLGIIRKDTTTGTRYLYGMNLNAVGFNNTGKIVAQYYNGTTFSVPSISAVNDNKWHYAEMTISGTTMTLYVDGNSQGTTTITGTQGIPTGELDIGADPPNTGARAGFFQGFIDEPKIYGYARTAAQAKSDFNSRGTVNAGANVLGVTTNNQFLALSNGLVGYWKMDESSWTGVLGEIVDSSGNSNNGTAACSSCTIPTTLSGKFGNGGSFNGTNQYATVANTISGVKSVAFWINPTSVTSGGPIQLTSGAYVTISSGTISTTGLTSSTIYVNGVVSATLATGTWQHVVITSNAGISSNAIQFAKANGTFTNAVMDEVRFYNKTLTPVDVQNLYNYAPGPVAYYNFEEGQGSTVNDTSGYGNTGTWAGTLGNQWTYGKVGKAGNFNGTDNYVDMGQPSVLSLDWHSPFTIAAWINTSSSSSYNPILSKTDVFSNGYLFRAHGTLQLQLSNNAGANSIIVNSQNSVTDGRWHYVVATYDGSGTNAGVNIYIDGVSNRAGGGSNTLASSIANTGNVVIGKSYTGQFFNGKIDQERIYNYVISQKQIIADMNAGAATTSIGGSHSGPVGYWKFDEGYGTTAHNSGNGGSQFDGTLTNNSGSNPTWTTDGKFGKALNFNGTSSYVTVPGGGGLNNLQTGSISLWARWNGTQSNYFSLNGVALARWKNGTFWNQEIGLTTTNPATAKIAFNLYAQSTTDVQSSKSPGNNIWHNIIITYTSGSQKMYVDGVLSGTGTATGSISNDATVALEFGRANDGGPNYMAGSVDDVQVYPYILTAQEVKLIYNHNAAISLNSLSTNPSDGKTASNSDGAAYCVPGDTSTCSPPVAEYNFEEGTGSTVNDTSGNGNTGTWNGTLGKQWAYGKIGKAGNFNGTDNYVNLGTPANLPSGLGSRSMCAWAETNAVDNNFSWIAAYGTNVGDEAMFIGRNGTTLDSGGYADDQTVANFWTIGKWNYLCQTYDGTTAKLYANGSLLVSDNRNWHVVLNVAYIGRQVNNAEYWNGKIDDVRIYNYARTPAQIAWEYDQGKPIGWWKFDECQGETLNDSSGNGNSGAFITSSILPGACTDGTGTTGWSEGAVGKFNSSLYFDGTSDYVNVTANSPLNTLSGAFSVSAWVNATTLDSNYRRIISMNHSPSQSWFIENNGGSPGYLLFSPGGTSGQSGSNIQLQIGKWYHIVMTNDLSLTKLYINGVYDASLAFSGTTSTAGNIGIGADDNATTKWAGQIDDVRIYNYALTPYQVQLLYNGGAAARYGPVAGTP